MISVDPYLHKVYDRRVYNCLHFARDVWRELTGVDIQERLEGLFSQPRHFTRQHYRAFTQHKQPVDPCLVAMLSPRNSPHIGVFLRGRVLHLKEIGPEFQPLEVATIGFETVRYFTT